MIQETHKVKHKYVPWYRGGWDGVPIHKAVKFHYEFWRESFRLNPYGLSHGWYLFILLSQLCFLLGNLLVGTADGVLGARKGERHAWVSVVKRRCRLFADCVDVHTVPVSTPHRQRQGPIQRNGPRV
jgi:hypothetical protein